MSAVTEGARKTDDRIVTKERILGTAGRWRRFGEPTPAGGSRNEDGSVDYGVFGPGSVAWELMLHPVMMYFETLAQGMLQLTYKPISAGIRDRDPISRKAQAGTLTFFDIFDRAQRNSGIHAPMWFGDTATAKRIAKHLVQIHQKVAGDVIDVGEPELGGYQASSGRDAMWAALTEMHSILWLYETFAWRGGKPPRRLPPAVRDRFMAETVAYCELFGPYEDELPRTMAELDALYVKYDALWGHSDTMDTIPETGQSFQQTVLATAKKNFHISQLRVLKQIIKMQLWNIPVMAAMSGKARANLGAGPRKIKLAFTAKRVLMPVFWLMQRRPFERRHMRLLWGPDGVELIESARKLHAQARKDLTW
ncbi:oxygenase MpaB family protein [Streptomyces mangrovisoli]|uniref:ER-bound oxygenase mpaB/mpaB'/Rubber oxygenase catalytic domain-containing protein n=1 Tax=Streptomyces mangrovisoli TaxID=1428628 RepID=A0A1J4NUZ0_9ACTN|nr:oxygenase MpaB family protein [Streptomyces mangrovisoli]OIJ64950.1 hypothetical protein WN71_026030 [Streptomyces mangrovisoli]